MKISIHFVCPRKKVLFLLNKMTKKACKQAYDQPNCVVCQQNIVFIFVFCQRLQQQQQKCVSSVYFSLRHSHIANKEI